MKNFKGLMLAFILGVIVIFSAQKSLHIQAKSIGACSTDLIKAAARQDIEYLRRNYAKATDLLAITEEASFNEGLEIYRSIFTVDADFSVSGDGAPDMSATGPDAWADIVEKNLGPMGPTQHLIGTQRVIDLNVDISSDCKIQSGSAKMESYVQAWHDLPNSKIWHYLGSYFDNVIYVSGKGWQIEKMNLMRITTETRNKLSDQSVAKNLCIKKGRMNRPFSFL